MIPNQNERLCNEPKAALEQQRASGEVLAAISSSIADTAPVFDKILDSCERLFEGNVVGLMLARDGTIDRGAYYGPGFRAFKEMYLRSLLRDCISASAI